MFLYLINKSVISCDFVQSSLLVKANYWSLLSENVAGGPLTLHCPWPWVGETSASSQANRQTDGQRKNNRIILWWLWSTDLNCSVHGVAHSYIPPCQRELKLREFKVTLMFGCDALSSARFHFYQPANSPQSGFHCRPGLTHYTVYYERAKHI